MARIGKIDLKYGSIASTVEGSELGFHIPLLLLANLEVLEELPDIEGFPELVRDLNSKISKEETKSNIEQRALRDYALRKLDLEIIRLVQSADPE